MCVVTSAHDFNDDRIFHKQIKSFLDEGWNVTYLSKPPAFAFEHPGFKHISIPPITGKLKRITAINKLFKLCMHVDTDVYHMHDPELIFLARKLHKQGKKVVFDVHEDYKSSILATGLPFKGIIAQAWDKLEKSICNKLDYIVCADSYIYNRYNNPNKLVLGNYPPKSFLPDRIPEKPDIFTIVYAGGVNKARGVERLIFALDKVDAPFRLSLIGPCSDPDLEKLIRSRSYIDYHGKVDWTEVKNYLIKGSIGVALYEPSINFTYCTGEGIVKIFEYLGNGLPVITSDFPNLANFINSNNVGTTVDPLSIENIAEEVMAYIQNPEKLKTQAAQGYKLVNETYNWDMAKQILIDVYRDKLLK